MVTFGPNELPVAFSMIRAIRKLKKDDPERHPFDKYSYLWPAFNEIYRTVGITAYRSPGSLNFPIIPRMPIM